MKSSRLRASAVLAQASALAIWACAHAEDASPVTSKTGGATTGPGPTAVGNNGPTTGPASSTTGVSSTSTGTTGAAGAPGTTGGAGAGSGGSGGVTQDVIDNADIVLLYKVDDESALSASIFTHLYLRNQSDEAFPLEAAEVRYWFDDDGLGFSQASHYQGPAIGGAVTLAPASLDGEQYMGITFAAGASLPANTGDINASEFQLKIDASGGTFDQANDYSFAPQFTSATEHDKVTVYLAGKLVWGCEPSGICAGDGGLGGAAGAAGAAGAPAD